jgi:hypothetical protein
MARRSRTGQASNTAARRIVPATNNAVRRQWLFSMTAGRLGTGLGGIGLSEDGGHDFTGDEAKFGACGMDEKS